MQHCRLCVLGVVLVLGCRGRAVEEVDRSRAVSDDPPRSTSAQDAATPERDAARSADPTQATGVHVVDAGPLPQSGTSLAASDALKSGSDAAAPSGTATTRPDAPELDAGVVADEAREALLNAPAEALYGLSVGARWLYLRSDGTPRWKEVTACEDVEVREPDTGELHVVRAYVRQNFNTRRLVSVHYLTTDATGVHRVRRDDGRPLGSSREVYTPPLLRLRGGHELGEQYEFSQQVDGYTSAWEPTGSYVARVVDRTRSPRVLNLLLGRTDTLVVERTWDRDASGIGSRVLSYYAPGMGEVYEQSTELGVEYPATEIEELAWFVPGQGRCSADGDAGTGSDAVPEAPWILCDNPWGTGVRGATDPRVDTFNCGECDAPCEGGTCAAGQCLQSEAACPTPCVGGQICCQTTDGPACVAPSRDVDHCGACGSPCQLDQICDRGTCTCSRGQADCANDGTCQDLLEDRFNCGECGHVCPDTAPHCELGLCGECLAPAHRFCDGVCKDLLQDDDACGDCNTRCGPGTGTLRCEFGLCLPCVADGLADCNGTCAELQWSDEHCGRCGHACARDEVCVFGECQAGDGSCAMTCLDDDQICCDEQCVDPRNNPWHCSGCGAVCSVATDQCSNGECVPENDVN